MKDDLILARWLAIMVIVFLPLLGILHNMSGTDTDPIIYRLVITGLCILTFILSFTSSWFKMNIIYAVYFVLILISIWLAYMMYINNLNFQYVLGMAVTILAGPALMKSKTHLLYYSIFLIILIFISIMPSEVPFISKSMFILTFMALIITLYFIFNSKLTMQNKLQLANAEITSQKEKLEETNTHISDSINYAQNIQRAILPKKEIIYNSFPGAFVLFKPKDVVSGDFYWFSSLKEEENSKLIIATVDCTGHGVPGAFMSMIGYELLNEIVLGKRITQPSLILNKLHKGIIRVLRQEDNEAKAMDGMDIALCCFDKEKNILQYAGAHRPLNLFQNGEFIEIKADKRGIGGLVLEERNYTNHTLELHKGDTFYMSSDGYPDQFGGPRDKKYGSRRLKEKLASIQEMDMKEQDQEMNTELKNWKGNCIQTDDILLIGVRV